MDCNRLIKSFLIFSILFNIILMLLCVYICCFKTDIFKRTIYKLTNDVYTAPRNDDDCVKSWNSCIRKLEIDSDIVFFGNSITEGGEFQEFFHDKKVVVMGYIGEDTKGMLRRVNAISSVNPEKIFLMAGINGLKSQQLDYFSKWYEILVDSIKKSNPNTELYIQSILPVEKNSVFCNNEKIRSANLILQEIARERKLIFIDLHEDYFKDGGLDQDMSYDGVHLKKESYTIWVEKIKKYVYD